MLDMDIPQRCARAPGSSRRLQSPAHSSMQYNISASPYLWEIGVNCPFHTPFLLIKANVSP
eukprot:scaffold10946_cov114-Isochrysis_galbana.AAC.8